MSSETQTMMYVQHGLEIFGVLVVTAALIHLIFYPLYKKHTGHRYRVKTVIVPGRANHYYAQFKPGWDYNWGTIDMYKSGNYQVLADQNGVIQFDSFDEAESLCRGYKEYRTPTLSDVNEETYTEVCEK